MPGFIITLGTCATRGTVFLCWYFSVMLIIYSKLKNEKKLKTTNHSRASCFLRSHMTSRLIAWRRLAVCSRNVAIYITRDYIVRQTKNLAFLLLFTTMNNHNLFHKIFKVFFKSIVCIYNKPAKTRSGEYQIVRRTGERKCCRNKMWKLTPILYAGVLTLYKSI